MQSVLGDVALRVGGELHDVADLVLVGLVTGEWQALEARVARGVALEQGRCGEVVDEQLERSLTAFRYERQLIAAADLEWWLAERSLRLHDLQGVLRRGLLLADSEGIAPSPPAAGRVATVMRAEAICSGALSRSAGRLRAWHAGSVWSANAQEGARSGLNAAADAAQIDALVYAALDHPASGLPALEAGELRRRAERLVALNEGYEQFRADAVSDREIDARLEEHRMDWTVVSGDELSFEREGAALETRLRVLHDGDTLAEVAGALGLRPVAREIELGDAPPGLRGELLAARDGDLVGPWPDGGRWCVLAVDGRLDRGGVGDGRFRERAHAELLGELVERLCAGEAGVVAAL